MAAPGFAYPVDFIGGPLDGWVDMCASPARPFVGLVLKASGARLPMLRRLLTTFGCAKPLPPRMAIYELDADDTGCCYRYLRTQLLTSECELSEAVYLTDATT